MAEIEDDGFVTVHHSAYVATQGTRRELIEKGIIRSDRVQHVKRGSTYRVIGRGKVQTDLPLTDYAEVVIYQCEADGTIWARPVEEFEDGRFLNLQSRAPDAISDEIASWKMAADEAEREVKILRGRCNALTGAAIELVDRDVQYHGSEIRIPAASHGDAIRLVAQLRAAANLTNPSEARADE